MAVKKGILDNFLKPNSHYSDNQKNLRSIFIDKSEEDLHLPETEIEEPDTNYTQTTHKPDTNQTQSEHKPDTNYTQTTHKVHTKLNTTKTQSRHKPDTNYTQTTHISALIGVQRLILLFLFEECKKARSHVTEPMSIIHIANGIKIASGSIKTSISRLCEKNFLKVNCFKNGRGGWSSYEIPDDIYKELLQMETQHKLHTNYTQSRHKVDTKLNTQLNTNLSSSSSSDFKNTTTTGLSEDWNFDIASYERFGFKLSHIRQLASLGIIEAAAVEQSLIEFGYDFDSNMLPPIKTSKINFLMGLLRSGCSYISEGFKTEQDSMIGEMARREAAKREDRLKEKFGAWQGSLTDQERKEIEKRLPTHLMALYRSHGMDNAEIRKWLFEYFIQKM